MDRTTINKSPKVRNPLESNRKKPRSTADIFLLFLRRSYFLCRTCCRSVVPLAVLFFFALLRSQRHCLSAFVFLRSDRTYFLIFFFCSAHRRHSNRCRTAASWLDRLSRATADIFENINTWHFRRSDLLILFHFDWTARPSAEKKRVRRRFDSFRRRRLARRTTQTKENAPKIERLTEFFIAIDADFCFCFFYFFFCVSNEFHWSPGVTEFFLLLFCISIEKMGFDLVSSCQRNHFSRIYHKSCHRSCQLKKNAVAFNWFAGLCKLFNRYRILPSSPLISITYKDFDWRSIVRMLGASRD